MTNQSLQRYLPIPDYLNGIKCNNMLQHIYRQ